MDDQEKENLKLGARVDALEKSNEDLKKIADRMRRLEIWMAAAVLFGAFVGLGGGSAAAWMYTNWEKMHKLFNAPVRIVNHVDNDLTLWRGDGKTPALESRNREKQPLLEAEKNERLWVIMPAKD